MSLLRPPVRAALTAALALTAGGAVAVPAAQAQAPGSATTRIQLLGVNDFHGALEPRNVLGRAAGGAAFLDAHLDQATLANPGATIRVHAGDMVGASPLISSLFHDEPAIKALNLMEFDVGTLGNHEFDEGGRELRRLLDGGRRRDGLQFKRGPDGRLVNTSDPDFEGADFPYIAANTRLKRNDELLLPPVKVIRRQGVSVGFIGVTTEDTPNIVAAKAISPFRFTDISDTVNRQALRLSRRGVRTIVVLAHSGAFQDRTDPTQAAGEIIDETREMSSEVDVVIAGHTHSQLNQRVPNDPSDPAKGDKLVVEAFAFGTAFDQVTLDVNRRTGEVADKTGTITTTYNDLVTPDAATGALVDDYRERAAPIANRVVGTAAGLLANDRLPVDYPLGSLIADAQRAFAGTQIALMNPGGIRAPIEAGEVTYGELFTTQPFGNALVRFSLTGADLKAALEQQFTATGDRILSISGFTYRYTRSAPEGGRIADLALADGTPIDPVASYTVVANEFIQGGGDAFTVLRDRAQGREVLAEDIEALVQYVEGLPQPFTAPSGGTRITLVP